MSVYDKYEMTIGIECHVQLDTKTKLFSTASNDARDQAPNAATNHIDWALPGMLPVLNKQAIVLAVRAGKALGSAINKISRFDRKHYFYPDLPKGYQTSQFYQPIIGPGKVEVELEGETFAVRIEHAHLEEDAGKLTHGLTSSFVDLNRSGTPLIEIVTMPDIHSAAQARAFAEELHRLMIFSGVTQGDLYQGNMRFDVNISVAEIGADELGKRAEVKNLNSFRSVERAAQFEFERQVDLLEAGEQVVQETRGFDEAKQKTFSQRSKEEAQDYRYMPDPDIPPVVLTEDDIKQMQADMDLLPPAYRQDWSDLGFDLSVEEVLLTDPDWAKTVTTVKKQAGNKAAKLVANWIASVIEDKSVKLSQQPNLQNIIELSQLVNDDKLSSTNAKLVLLEMLTTQAKPLKIAEQKKLLQVSDNSAIEKLVEVVLATEAGQKALEDVKNGNPKALGFVVGQVMKQSKGQANPQLVQQILQTKLKGE